MSPGLTSLREILIVRSAQHHALRHEAFMFRVFVFLLVAALLTPAPAVLAAPGGAQAQTGTISGTATTQQGQTAASYTIRVRNVQTNELAGSTTTAANGTYTVSVPGGQYVVELVDVSGKVVGTTAAVAVTPGATVTANVAATSATASGGKFPLAVVVGVAAAGGVAADVAGAVTASPSR